MNRLSIQFEADPGADGAALSTAVQDRLRKLPHVEDAQIRPSKQRMLGIGAGEVVAVLSGAVLIAQSSEALIAELRKLIPQIAALVHDIKGLRGAFVEVEGKRVPVEKLSEEQLAKAVQG